MYCPNCGLEENQNTQFCRSCGADLGVVRTAVINPQVVQNTPDEMRKEVASAVARKIETIESSRNLRKTVERVLPQVEKFLESPQEKRLRRIRNGSIVSMVGLGVAVGFFAAGLFADPDLIVVAALGFVTLFVGLALVINGYLFSEPKDIPQILPRGEKPEINTSTRDTNELLMPQPARVEISSVTENTTRTLDEKMPARTEPGKD